MFLIGGIPAGMAWSQGKIARRITRMSGERAFVSRVSIIAVTRVGLYVIIRVLGSLKEEGLVGVVSLLWLFLEEAVCKMDVSASLGFLMNMARSVEPYLLSQARLACFVVSLMAVLCRF